MPTVDTLARDVRVALARLTGTHKDDWFLVFRARYGMETVLNAVKEHAGSGEVITQPFTCATAVNPIMSAGHIPVYIDTSYEDFSLDTSKLQASANSRALIMQHTFSLQSNIVHARAFADKHNLLLMEDSAHHVGMMAKKDGQHLADVSVHSFGVEKLLPTKFGGAIWVNPSMKDTELRDLIRSEFATLPPMTRKQSALARRYRLFNRTLNHAPSFIEPALRRVFIAVGWFEPAIMADELTGKNHDAPARPDAFVLKGMLHGLKQHASIVEKRSKTASLYRDALAEIFTLPKNTPGDYAPARFPLLCQTATEATYYFDVLRAAGHYSGKWYRPTLFPGPLTAKSYNYDPETCPVAEDIAARILNLPTSITVNEAREIADALQRKITR